MRVALTSFRENDPSQGVRQRIFPRKSSEGPRTTGISTRLMIGSGSVAIP
jgi:hypothetical protein